ncbi:sucrose phosphorylase [Rhabdothermincola salaria]|uniref:sucrose phosphorylase n=1 Tax=Rhabdothermincola salaria TaxID=2903142 RepID=UPI001E500110|nr:sucrose phosphorylase [Rhabdothermincola salaria]MCD9622856.1 sucrose phosphorylase [Rhabdothermincola salaria]
MRNEPQLIAYADRFGGDLAGLGSLLDGPLAGAFGGVHVLPFFHPIDGADAGFDPIDHTTVDARLGTWDDVAALGADRELVADLIVNHVSARSPQFLDWAARGESSPYDGMFLTYESVYPEGATEADLLATYRPRPGMSFSVKGVAGERRLVWTTFTSEQVDVDVGHPATREYLHAILDRFAACGVGLVRLDAVGYAVKGPGTSSFMIPETFVFIDQLADACRARGLEMLVEVHGHHRTQIDIAGHVDWVYDFALPPLVLDALFRGSNEGLVRWLSVRPTNAVTVLDTHDGIGVIDVGRDQSDHSRPGLLTQEQIDGLVEEIHRRSGGASRLATGEAADNLDVYQVNCSFYDALGRDDARYLAARLIQVLVPGVPQIYYVGALAGTNDMELLAHTGVGRDINRHHYTDAEITAAVERPVVQRLLALLRWRRGAAALFEQGAFSVEPGADHELILAWRGDDSVVATIDLRTGTVALELTEAGSTRTVTDVADLSRPG